MNEPVVGEGFALDLLLPPEMAGQAARVRVEAQDPMGRSTTATMGALVLVLPAPPGCEGECGSTGASADAGGSSGPVGGSSDGGADGGSGVTGGASTTGAGGVPASGGEGCGCASGRARGLGGILGLLAVLGLARRRRVGGVAAARSPRGR